MSSTWIDALFGGALIGISVSLMLLLNGRVVGINGIVYGLLKPVKGEISWRIYFLTGIVAGGLVLQILKPEVFHAPSLTSDWSVGIAGLLVGFGTVLGSGCTSGHGVCGISRMSPRSIIATVFFIASGVSAVFIFKSMGILR